MHTMDQKGESDERGTQQPNTAHNTQNSKYAYEMMMRGETADTLSLIAITRCSGRDTDWARDRTFLAINY